MVIFEAARAITELTNVTSLESTPPVIALQLFSSSYKPGLRFAAVQAFNKVERFYYKFFFLVFVLLFMLRPFHSHFIKGFISSSCDLVFVEL